MSRAVQLQKLHQGTWSGAVTWMGFGLAFVVLEALLLAALTGLEGPGQWIVCAGLVLVLAHLMHGHLIAFHEAAHGLLCPVRWLNEFLGMHVGLLSLTSLALFRAVHHTHHAYLTTERDEELWPFVLPTAPRWARRLAAFFELTCGLVYLPFLFLRAFLRPGSAIRNQALRRRIWGEQLFIVAVWAAVLTAVAWWDLWIELVVLYLAPAALAANAHSLRKYIEHLGLTGSTVLGVTRSVHAPGWAGRLVAFSLFNEPYHGVHHKHARLPQESLPLLVDELTSNDPAEPRPYASYRSALADMLRSLPDPHVGPQWRPTDEAPLRGES